MKKTLLVAAVAISALFAGGAAMAQDAAGSLSYNLAVTSNYVWRGVSQTNDKAAIQGGIDYSKGLFYAGAWASNVDFSDGAGNKANTELDLYLGLTPSLGNYHFDFGAIAYTYPGADKGGDFNVGELKAAVSHPMGKGTIGAVMYLPTKSLEDPYYEVNASYPLTDKWSVSGALGNYESAGYTTQNFGVTYAINDKLGLDLRWSDAEKMPSTFAATLKATF
ncbi:TorF family putative porin [Asticcacaulis sp. EMRT-3]|uniref:TorF family putative porin n=1 Tax=Asticcacaulis sp. EMRT-3 TaxID=3040349 RepID=UPI0024AF34E0|nr:TorF family putative porin [Asticcacaulis sp. EMRT-3]MDI7774806.1 TorF family putative porin [Asticcacaulis sp. EMRT-3]